MLSKNLPRTADIEDLKGRYISHGKLICSFNYTGVHPNISTITYHCNGSFLGFINDNTNIKYGASFKLNSYDPENTIIQLDERFLDDELFYVNKFQDNNSYHDTDPYFAFGNATIAFEQEFIEIYEGVFNEQQDFFIPDEQVIYNLLEKKYQKGARIYFYIKSNENIYGPFTINNVNSNQIKLSPVHRNNDNIYKWSDLNRIDHYILEFEIKASDGNEINRIISYGWLDENFSTEKIKFVSDDNLLGWIKQKISVSAEVKKSDYNTFKTLYQIFSNLEVESNEGALYERSLKLLNNSNQSKINLDGFIEKLESTQYIKDSISTLKEEIDSITTTKAELEKEAKEMQINIENLHHNKTEILNELDQLQEQANETIAKQIEEAQEKNAELKKSILENEEIQTELDKINDYKNLKRLKEEIAKSETIIDYLKRDKSDLNETIQVLSQQFIETQKTAQEKLRDLVKSKTHFDFISGRDFEDNTESIENQLETVKVKPFTNINIEDTNFISYEKLLLDKVVQSLKLTGRNYKSEFVANILISIFQNTATIFAGLPGTGKTSLARIISQILCSIENKRVEIPVAKGWTSQKDFIGFYNPLSKKFIPTNQTMYRLLKISNKEVENSSYLESCLGFVILDEANLSPIEHYWSSFYNLTDSICNINSMLHINLGSDQILSYPNNIRFIGTINIDQTTEELSPRFLDRTNVIRIPLGDDDNLNYSADYIKEIESIDFTLKDAIDLFNLFDFDGGHKIEEYEKESFKSLRDEYKRIKVRLREINIIISPRIDKAFSAYFLTAIKFMPQYKALDFFIAQRLLTKVDGQGEAYGEILKSIKDDLINIFSTQRVDSDSVRLIEQIIEVGSHDEYYHNYNYFLVN